MFPRAFRPAIFQNQGYQAELGRNYWAMILKVSFKILLIFKSKKLFAWDCFVTWPNGQKLYLANQSHLFANTARLSGAIDTT